MSNFHSHILTRTSFDLSSNGFRALYATAGALICAYLFFLGVTVFNIMRVKAAELSIRTASSEIGNLELQYFAHTKSIDLAYAEGLGFKEAAGAVYVSRENHVAMSTHMTRNEL